MPEVVSLQFRPVSKLYDFDAQGFEDLQVGDLVVVETRKGREVGEVVIPPHTVEESDIPSPLKGILRRATAWDLTQMVFYQMREEHALEVCREKVAESGLPMKLVTAEYNFDGSHLTFYFTAEQRVDFRQLVRELARTFRTRIELRQIGVRDEVKLIGGYGLCGRPHCCASWMRELDPISIRTAKDQGLPLNPAEISGTCGRLLCCLRYEVEMYRELRKGLPREGKRVITPYGEGKVKVINVLKGTVTVVLKENESEVEIPASEIGKPPANPEE